MVWQPPGHIPGFHAPGTNAPGQWLAEQAALAARHQAPRLISPEDSYRMAVEAQERERVRRELAEQAAAERRAHDTRVAEREKRLGWPAARVRMARIDAQMWRFTGYPPTSTATGMVSAVILLTSVIFTIAVLVGVAQGSERAQGAGMLGAVCLLLPTLFAVVGFWRWRRTRRGLALRAELNALRSRRGCGVRGCATCHT